MATIFGAFGEGAWNSPQMNLVRREFPNLPFLVTSCALGGTGGFRFGSGFHNLIVTTGARAVERLLISHRHDGGRVLAFDLGNCGPERGLFILARMTTAAGSDFCARLFRQQVRC